MNTVKKAARLILMVSVLSAMPIFARHAIGIELPGAKYTEEEYSNAVKMLASQDIHREHPREKRISLTCFFGWLAGDYFSMKDQQFDEIYNPIFFKQAQERIRSIRHEQKISRLNKILSDCRALYEARVYDKALDACQSTEFEVGANINKETKFARRKLMGNIYEKLGDYANARKEYAKASVNAQNSSSKIALNHDSKRVEAVFVKTFLNEDYHQRKFIIPVTNIQSVNFPEHINILDVKNLPDIEFRNGRPAVNQLYVGHPYIANQYVPFEDSQYEFLRDRIGEFVELMQALGATEVEVKSVRINQQEYDLENNTEMSGHMSAILSKVIEKLGILPANTSNNLPKENVSAAATYKKKESGSVNERIFYGLKTTQVFNPQKRPFLPQGLTWYIHEPSWQRLYRERIQGNLLQHTETISTKNNKVMQNSELSQIGGELGTLLVSIDANRDKTTMQSSKTQEDVELAVDVKFAPLDSLK